MWVQGQLDVSSRHLMKYSTLGPVIPRDRADLALEERRSRHLFEHSAAFSSTRDD